jgi:hypothetical protein
MLPNITDFMLTMAATLFIMGLIALGVGIYTLSSNAIGRNVRVIANQMTKLGQKGISEDVAGLVGNASSLLAGLNTLVRSSAGIGTLLIAISFILIAAAYGLLIQVR